MLPSSVNVIGSRPQQFQAAGISYRNRMAGLHRVSVAKLHGMVFIVRLASCIVGVRHRGIG